MPYTTKKKITFLDLLRPDAYLPPEVGLGVFTWMLKTGWDYRTPGPWGSSGVFEQAFGLSSTNAIHYSYHHPLQGPLEPFLRQAFTRLLLNRTQSLNEWREAMGISLTSSRILHFLYDGEDSHVGLMALKWLLTLNTEFTTFKVTPHPLYDGAVDIHSIPFYFQETKWHCNVHYGYDGSAWYLNPDLHQKDDESILSFAYRCYTFLAPQIVQQPSQRLLNATHSYEAEYKNRVHKLVTAI
jgi:hypothetical protein